MDKTSVVDEMRDSAAEKTPSPSYAFVDYCAVETPGPRGLVIFGASGDLTARKLMPSLYRLFAKGLLPNAFFVLGTSRSEMDDAGFRASMADAVRDAAPGVFEEAQWSRFAERLHYTAMRYEDDADFRKGLRERLQELERKFDTQGNRIFYLAVPPQVFSPVIENLGASALSRDERGCSHLVVEKPFGRDLESARELNRRIHRHFRENQIFRIDHYLAKETVQNLLMFRFANTIFEPLWNQRYVDHVQITAAETLGIGSRAGYYEQAGVLRDMFQNHMLQLLCLTAMEPPSAFIADRVRDEKAKVLRSLRRPDPASLEGTLALGQYGRGRIDGAAAAAYREAP